MRTIIIVGALVAGLASCGDDARSLGSERLTGAPPQFAATAEVPDLDGVPDLTVDAKRLERTWMIREEEMSVCAVAEGGASPGTHRILRFTATTPNIGTADVFVGDPLEHVAANDGTFEFAICHDHYHFRNYAIYELISVETGQVLHSVKRGFCMVDVTRWSPGSVSGRALYNSCGTRSSSGFQGVSVGWADTYARTLDGQFFVLDEPAAPAPPGDYIIRITVNPPFVCGEKDAARPRDADGMCRMFVESRYDNNVGEAVVTLSEGRGPTGPGAVMGLPEDELASLRTKTGHPHDGER
jgi:hypothetical protein